MNRKSALAIAACAVVAALLVFVFASRDAPEDADAPANRPAGEAAPTPIRESASTRGLRIEAIAGGTAPLPSGATLVVPRSLLAADRPFAVKLKLAQPENASEALSGRILTAGRELALSAAVSGEASDVAWVEIDAGWLTPGRYVIEIHTSERSHFPLRRYALEVE